jgi:hypothetical protein
MAIMFNIDDEIETTLKQAQELYSKIPGGFKDTETLAVVGCMLAIAILKASNHLDEINSGTGAIAEMIDKNL